MEKECEEGKEGYNGWEHRRVLLEELKNEFISYMKTHVKGNPFDGVVYEELLPDFVERIGMDLIVYPRKSDISFLTGCFKRFCRSFFYFAAERFYFGDERVGAKSLEGNHRYKKHLLDHFNKVMALHYPCEDNDPDRAMDEFDLVEPLVWKD